MAQTIGYYLTGNTHTLMKGYIPEKNKAYKIYYNDGFAKFVQLNNLEMINKLPRVRTADTDAAVYWHVEHHPEGDRISSVTVAGDTDSVAGDSVIQTSLGEMTFEQFFNKCDYVIEEDSGKEYAVFGKPTKALSYNGVLDKADLMMVKMVYRHKVTKKKYKITLEDGATVCVTGDHSLMVERMGNLIEIKPNQLLENDIFLSINK